MVAAIASASEETCAMARSRNCDPYLRRRPGTVKWWPEEVGEEGGYEPAWRATNLHRRGRIGIGRRPRRDPLWRKASRRHSRRNRARIATQWPGSAGRGRLAD